MEEYKHLPESELDIMLVVWAAGGEIAAPAILEGLSRPLTASALHSYLKRLEEKGFLSCRKEGRTNWYTALVSRENYQEQEGKSVLEKLYAGSLKRFAAALYDGGALKREDVDELRAYLDELEKGGH
ncbi:MAG: BlaI/MecI/CopY family transcriptional regulator [Oscillospiraceae bacterium]